MRTVHGYALLRAGAEVEPWTFERRDLRPDDVAVRVAFCGVCHSDLHALAGGTDLPLVPGHEFVGEVVEVGRAVERFTPGEQVAVGNIVGSCRTCEQCSMGRENLCEQILTLTYGGADRLDGRRQYGAWSSHYVAAEHFVYSLPQGLDPAAAAPLMCAGVTTWEPLRSWDVGPQSRVGVVGLGGLGHLAVKFAAALGAHVTVFTTSPDKVSRAVDLGAADVVVSSDPDAMAATAGRLDFVLDTVSVEHDPSPYLRCLRMGGTVCMLGLPDRYQVDPLTLLGGRNLSASGSAGTRRTREMLDFCAALDITADVEVLPSRQVRTALDRLARNDVRYRFVLDMSDVQP